MKLALVEANGGTRLVAVGDRYTDLLIDLVKAELLFVADAAKGSPPVTRQITGSLGDLLALGQDGTRLTKTILSYVESVARPQLIKSGVAYSVDAVNFLPPLAPTAKVLCVGRNYAEHAAEVGKALNPVPMWFLRLHDSFVGHAQSLVKPLVSDRLDWEGELAVVIGAPCRHLRREEALDVIAGYTVLNEGSVRDYQHEGVQWTAGKNFWHSGSVGPYVVSNDAVPKPQNLNLVTRVNGTVRQQSNTAQMVFDIPALLEHVTRWTPLAPGDVIATGTPAGVGNRQKPPVFLVAGDRVEVEIQDVGVLVNTVVNESRDSSTSI